MKIEVLAQPNTAGQAKYGMANLRPQDRGLPFVVFISQREAARHAARVKWAPGPKVSAGALGSYALHPFAHKAGPRLDARQERSLEAWVRENLDTLQKSGDGDIEYTQDALALLRKAP